jgi:predicted transposase/invertase (TIGR01784 family)
MSTLVDREKLLNILEENMFKLENNPAIDFFVEKGVQRGVEEGVEKNKLETAVKMFKANFPLATISQILEMPIEWVENVVNRG